MRRVSGPISRLVIENHGGSQKRLPLIMAQTSRQVIADAAGMAIHAMNLTGLMVFTAIRLRGLCIYAMSDLRGLIAINTRKSLRSRREAAEI